MARSYRHTPIIGITTARSDKPGKVNANRTLRAASRNALVNCRDYDNLVMPVLRDVSSPWDFPKDGKQYMRDVSGYLKKYMRK